MTIEARVRRPLCPNRAACRQASRKLCSLVRSTRGRLAGPRAAAGVIVSGTAFRGVGGKMPVFMVERRFAEELEAASDVLDGINRINEEEGVRWLYSFLSSDRRKTYCLYEAPSPDAIRRAAVGSA